MASRIETREAPEPQDHLKGSGKGWSGAPYGAAVGRNARRQRRLWSSRVDSWSSHASVELHKVTAAVIATSRVRPAQRVVDLGCGTGQLALPMAQQGGAVFAVDVSAAMVSRLREEAAQRGTSQLIEAAALPIEGLSLPPGSVDLVVSSYALHHVRDPDKAAVVQRALEWLRPGGRIVIADMMIGRGAIYHDRAILAHKVKVLARLGPGGWWRIAKNAVRFLLRVQERPLPLGAWSELLVRAGFECVEGTRIVEEAGMVTGRKPIEAART